MPIVVAEIPWEKVAPVLFFGLFYIAKVFMDRNQGDPPQVDPVEAERAKRLQEEIRRAIAERNRKYQEENTPRQAPTAPPSVPQSQPTGYSPVQQPTVPVPSRRHLEGTNQPAPQRAIPQPVTRVEVTPAAQVIGADSSNANHGTIAGMRGSGLTARQLFERQMAADYAAAYADTSDNGTTEKAAGTFGQEIVNNLTEMNALRRAFVTAEIIGPPVANKY